MEDRTKSQAVHRSASPRRRIARWAWMPIGLLGSLMSIQVVMVVIAINDPAFAVEPDYYEKATHWDETTAQRAEGAQLGWSVVLERLRWEPGGTTARAELRVTDREGQPLVLDSLASAHFQNARAALRGEVTAEAQGAGVYAIEFPARRSGLWQFELTLTRGQQLFRTSVSGDLPGATEGGQ